MEFPRSPIPRPSAFPDSRFLRDGASSVMARQVRKSKERRRAWRRAASHAERRPSLRDASSPLQAHTSRSRNAPIAPGTRFSLQRCPSAQARVPHFREVPLAPGTRLSSQACTSAPSTRLLEWKITKGGKAKGDALGFEVGAQLLPRRHHRALIDPFEPAHPQAHASRARNASPRPRALAQEHTFPSKAHPLRATNTPLHPRTPLATNAPPRRHGLRKGPPPRNTPIAKRRTAPYRCAHKAEQRSE